jgi:hypothetical protein
MMHGTSQFSNLNIERQKNITLLGGDRVYEEEKNSCLMCKYEIFDCTLDNSRACLGRVTHVLLLFFKNLFG